MGCVDESRGYFGDFDWTHFGCLLACICCDTYVLDVCCVLFSSHEIMVGMIFEDGINDLARMHCLSFLRCSSKEYYI